MPKKNLVNEELKIDLPDYTGKSVSVFSRHKSFGFLAFIVLAILFSLLIYQRYLIIKQEQKKEAFVMVNNAKDKLQEALSSGLSATKILSFFIDNNGVVKNFDSVAEHIFSTNKNIDVLELVAGGVIQFVYPLKGNENLIGYDILKDPTRNKEAFKAIEKKELFFSGPFNLKQGGFGIVGRLPVFRNGKFWGFSAVVIKIETLLKAAGIDRTGKDGYYFQLSKINPNTKKREFFIPHAKEPLKDYLISVDIPDGEWKLSVEPIYIGKDFAEIYILALLGFLFSVLGTILVFIIVKRPEKLERLVKERTKAFKASENKYRSLIERVSDAFVSLDNDWNFNYLNDKAEEIFNRKPQSLLGKNIWTEFPQSIDKPFYHTYYLAKETQQYQDLEEYYPLHGKWFENHIYPSKDGLTIFFKDVTEIKKASLKLKENEEKYRSLIEQASDGIVITDLDGIILEVNKSMKAMIGFADEEVTGHHATAYIPNEDIELLPLRINKLMQGKSLLYERRLVKKDGSVLEVEVNSKMASSHTIIGFLRDITERKRSEEALKKSNERFELIGKATNDAIWEWNLETHELWGNEAHQQMYGLTMADSVPDYTEWERRLHADDRERMADIVAAALTSQHKSFEAEYRFYTENKGWINIYGSTYIDRNREGKAIRLIGNMIDITERKKVEGLLQKSYEDIRQLASNLQNIREDERTNIAREIHDELGQQLTGLKMDLHWLARKIKSADKEINDKMKESIELINTTITSVRKISTNLRPGILDDLGLLSALEWQGEEFQKRSGIKVEFINNAGEITVQPEATTAIFRIYQELLTNIARHAKASLVRSVLYKDESRLYFSITDNGVGFNLETISNKRTLGLLGIKERTLLLGGTYEFKSKPGEGSVTTISVPLNLVNSTI